MITNREKALAHIYPDLAGLTNDERRQFMVDVAQVYSSRQLNQAGFEKLMAAFEAELWHRVDLGRAPDPRLCRTCSRPLTHGRDGYGQCPEGCERRKVYAWKRTYWRDKLPADTSANTRLVWKVKRYWKLLLCYLPEAEQNDHYLAGIIAHTTDTTSRRDELLEGDSIAWPRVTPEEARRTIEALKDRLTHAVNKHAEATS